MIALLAGIAGVVGLVAGALVRTVVRRVWNGTRSADATGRRYPLIELITGVLFAMIAVRFGGEPSSAWALPAFWYLAAVGVALAVIDLGAHRLPNSLVLPSYGIGTALLIVASAGAADWSSLISSVLGAAVLFTFYLVLALGVPGGMGFGDVKLAGVLGMYLGWLGWASVAVGTVATFLLGGGYAVALLATRRAGRRSGIPFGPWMLAGALVGTLFGEAIASRYLVLVGFG